MTQKTNKSLGLSLGYLGAGLVAILLGLIGLSWFFQPETNSLAFGVELSAGRQLSFAYIKAAENVIAAVLLGTFLWRRDRVGTMLSLLAVLIVPLGDALSLYRVGVPLPDTPWINAVFVAVILASLVLLGSGKSGDEFKAEEEEREDVVLPRTIGKRIVLAAAGVMIAVIAFGFTTRWMVGPERMSTEFGASLSGMQVAFAYVKGFEDMFVSAAILLFAWRRKRKELMLVLAISLLVVVGDQLAQTLAGFFVPAMFIAHLSYLTVVGGAIAVLWSSRASEKSNPEA